MSAPETPVPPAPSSFSSVHLGAPRRRDFLGGLGGAAVAGSAGLLGLPARAASYAFAHGVASGDPLADRLIIWTRVTASGDANPRVFWEISTDPGFARILRSGLAPTSAARDFTVKVDVTGLQPGTRYHYRFSCGGQRSVVGRARTLPAGDAAVERVRLAVFSCSNYPAGLFHAYAEAARMSEELDAALHLGDFIYEYDRSGYASANAAALGRQVLPDRECVSLADYRQRYAQYRSDPDLQVLSAALPLIAVWDDHELANNTYLGGAANHTEGSEGSFAARQSAALKAYHEWLPTRLPDPAEPARIYRSFDWGRLLSLHMLETRLLARSKQLAHTSYLTPEGIDGAALDAAVNAPGRQLLGRTQMDWLKGQLTASRATWQVLGQQVRMAETRLPASIALGQISFNGHGALQARAAAGAQLSRSERYILAQPWVPENLDAWDGYGAERAELLAAAQQLGRNLVSLAGDTHNAWADELLDAQGRHAGVEFATPGVSSPGLESSRLTDTPAQMEQWFLANCPNLRYAETAHRGFMVLSATPGACRADWHFVDSVESRDYRRWLGASRQVLPGQHRLLPV
ncbi:alkaline phosphatase D family protein [Roseateles sp. DAIF2]|uniref:alkaline phosphatase D family protein n=1 Tax=Roseateles sp. DAIF2 TaxID=2714952 RepID=UPI0018A2B395|nr:alkaline phosphatase D family protein [Roseateles sp. DAIF2]QPF74763.1 alkaline phosphatase D family protein [Roseateles sp. DAIF2]